MNYKEFGRPFSSIDYTEFERSFRYRKTAQSIPLLLEGIYRGRIQWDTMFAYTKSWTNAVKSAFIESILVGMPTADILCEENHYGELFVLDGVQRLMSLQEFFNDEFKLQGLKLLTSLEGFSHSELPYAQASVFQNRTELALTIISYDTDPILKFEFFKRVHSESYRFPTQLARNYAFRDHFYFIRDLQNNSSMYLVQKEPKSHYSSIEMTKANHREISKFDELYLLFCSASLIYYSRMTLKNTKYYYTFSDLLDETAIYLHRNQHDFHPLKDVVINTLQKMYNALGSKILFSKLKTKNNLSNYTILLNSDNIILCFIKTLNGENININDVNNSAAEYQNNISTQSFINMLLN